ncbi:MAG: hypothetical protein WC734_02500 [Patescibacteria group bacterium]
MLIIDVSLLVFFINFLAILPVDSQSSSVPFPSITLPDVDWAHFVVSAIYFVVWAIISYFAMRAILFGFRWGTAGTNEEYSEWSKSMFVQSTNRILIFFLLLVVISVLKSILGIAS